MDRTGRPGQDAKDERGSGCRAPKTDQRTPASDPSSVSLCHSGNIHLLIERLQADA